MSRLFKIRKNEKGQTLVEFALVLPVLLLLVMGVIQFGIIFSAQIALTNAAREGARAAAVGTKITDQTVGGNTILGVKSIVKNAMGGHKNIIVADGNITMNNPEVGEAVIVQINNAEITLFVPVPEVFVPGQKITLNAKASMRLEKKP